MRNESDNAGHASGADGRDAARQEADDYEAAMRAYLGREPLALRANPAEPYPRRDELYGRAVLRNSMR
jgi:hypothetical protein